ncbi:hypothetical protein MKW94_025073 [Papaver nudicaule]|uniref:Plant thionin family protein n=1 Tax=Papaver nudicaule TaxID=74823 RepID=A0AA41VWS3_PAPNU|nr:hypothetical protein [Papaver nudicaule]
MKGSGKSLMRMFVVVLLIVGVFVGRISASPESDFQACFDPCYYKCRQPNPKSPGLIKGCTSMCENTCRRKPPLHSHPKSLAN